MKGSDKSMFKEFKVFAMKGNILDMAIGIVIGVAFGKIISSFVSDIIMPPIGLILGKVDFSNLFINLSDKTYPTLAAAKAAGAPTINYGVFFNTVLDFLIVAFVLFLIMKQMSRFNRKEETVKSTQECPYCTSEISIRATRCPHCTADLK
jgi:large conductance mechanosensitive channel